MSRGWCYSAVLFYVSLVHVSIGLGHIFKVPPYNPAVFMVSGQPGTGETPLEKLLAVVLAGFYSGSILGVLIAYFYR